MEGELFYSLQRGFGINLIEDHDKIIGIVSYD